MSDPSNPQHLDEVVSAYVDGEATPEEVRLVEGDPVLMSQARELRTLVAMDQALPAPDPEMKRRHLAAAMAAFGTEEQPTDGAVASGVPHAATADRAVDGVVVDVADEPSPVIDLRTRRDRPAGVPRWLAAAAGALVVVGGIGFVATRDTGDDTAGESTSVADEAFPSRPDGDESGDAAASSEAFDEDDAMEEEAESFADDTEAMEDEAAEDSEAMADDEAIDDGSADAAQAASEEGSDADVELVEVSGDPTIDELLARTDGAAGFPLGEAACVASFEALSPETSAVRSLADAGGFVEWYPVLVDDELGEFVVVTSDDGERVGALFGPDCQPVEN